MSGKKPFSDGQRSVWSYRCPRPCFAGVSTTIPAIATRTADAHGDYVPSYALVEMVTLELASGLESRLARKERAKVTRDVGSTKEI